MSFKTGTQDLAFWWLKGLPPEPLEVAQARAEVCKVCPLNQDDLLFEPLIAAAGRALKAAFKQKHALDLHVQDEESLQTCAACGCPLQLKVWAPAKMILRDGKKPDYFKNLDPDCWIRKL